jgi:parallel beta-helix repeat protein
VFSIQSRRNQCNGQKSCNRRFFRKWGWIHTLGSASSISFKCSGINNVTIKSASVENFEIGIYLGYSLNNSIYGNNMTNNCYGIRLDDSSNNRIYHDNSINNGIQALSIESISVWMMTILLVAIIGATIGTDL